ncbi:glucose PTS transporter subunit IIA [Streptomyces sp. NPDC005407]|uniref:PTS sugar transporter subunit IIA n=1 Tax=Streptomyces sp. NPDC005407 TaxID=3155340 RepID=UPI0033B764E8
MTLTVYSPLGGEITPLHRVPDEVFASELVGSGLAVDPVDPVDPGGPCVAQAPIRGKIVKLHPHAFVVQAGDGTAVLVHLGIDTVRLAGEGFHAHVCEGDSVEVGQQVITLHPDAVRERGLSAMCPVVVLGSESGSAKPGAASGIATGGSILFTWPTS